MELLKSSKAIKTLYYIMILIILGCGTRIPDPEDEEEAPIEVEVFITATTSDTSQSPTRFQTISKPLGSIGDIVKIQLQVKQEEKLLQDFQLEKSGSNDKWEGRTKPIPIQIPTQFSASAFNSEGIEIFQGEVNKEISQEDNEVTIVLDSIDDGEPITIPSVKSVTYENQIFFFDVEGEYDDTLSYIFKSINSDEETLVASGKIYLSGIKTDTIQIKYDQPITTDFSFHLQNQDGYSSEIYIPKSALGVPRIGTRNNSGKIVFAPIFNSIYVFAKGSTLEWRVDFGVDKSSKNLEFLWETTGILKFEDPTKNPAIIKNYFGQADVITVTIQDNIGNAQGTYDLPLGKFTIPIKIVSDLNIIGDTHISEQSTYTYIAEAFYTYGQPKKITPIWEVDKDQFASIDSDGGLTTKSVNEDTEIKITAKYSNRTSTKTVIIHNDYNSLNSGLLAYYPFNGNVNDESGNENHGEIHSNESNPVLVQDRHGIAKAAYSFDGEYDFIDIGKFDLANSNFTISAWVRGNNKSYNSIFTENDGEFNKGVGLFQENGNQFTFILKEKRNSSNILTTKTKFSTDNWYHVVAVRSDEEITIYVNQQLEGSKTIIDWTNTNVIGSAKIGRQNDTLQNHMNGEIDDFRIYDRALSSSEVKALYDLEKPKLTSGLVAYYPLNDNTNDESGNGNHGIIQNGKFTKGLFGKTNQAVNFNGETDYIIIPDNPSIEGFSQITLSTWVYPSNFDLNCWADTESLITKGDHSIESNKYNLIIIRNIDSPISQGGCNSTSSFNSVKFGFQVFDTGVPSSIKYPPNIWYHVVATYNTGKLKLYVDGHLIRKSTSAPYNNLGDNSGDLFINHHTWYNESVSSQRMGGRMDNIRIYNRSLSESEIKELYYQEFGLIAYYPFNGNANDESGNGNHGKISGATLTTDRYGNSNNAYNFDGINDHIQLPKKIYDNLKVSGNFSLSVWFNSSSSSQNGYIFSGGKGSNFLGAAYGIRLETGELDGFIGSDSTRGYQRIFANEIISTDTWHHATLVLESSDKLLLYLDGVLTGEYTNPEWIVNENDNYSDFTEIGVLNTKNFQEWFNGKIDDFRIFKRALSFAEVQALYNLESSSLNKGLIAYYPFNGDANDESGNGNHGKIDGATLVKNRKGNDEKAYNFEGNDKISLPNTPFQFDRQSFSISVWFKTDQAGNIISRRGVRYGIWSIVLEENLLSANIFQGTTQFMVSTENLYMDNRWHHVFMLRNESESTLSIFVDGELKNSIYAPDGELASDFGITTEIGAYQEDHFFNGQIDDVRIYNRILSEAERQKLYYQPSE